MTFTLAPNGLKKLLHSESENESITVQVLKPRDKQGNSIYFPCFISDGYYKIRAAVSIENKDFTFEKANFCLITITKHGLIQSNGTKRGVQVKQFAIFGEYPEQIGDPVQYSPEAIVSEIATNFIDIDKFKSFKKGSTDRQSEGGSKKGGNKPIQLLQGKNGRSSRKSNQERGGVVTIQIDGDESVEPDEEITERRLKSSDRLNDLYPDLQYWEIVCRITDMNYKQFISKKSNKFTQILSIELMDRTGTKCEATVFGEYGKQLQPQLQVNSLYRISRGIVRPETFNKNKTGNFAGINIIFNQQSLFHHIKDNPKLIPESTEDQYFSVKEIFDGKDSSQSKDKFYDVAGILTEIGQEKHMTDKNGQELIKRTVKLSDPENQQTIDVTLWRDFKIDQELQGKTVILKNFRINTYMNNISLNSVFKSEIKPIEKHRYKQHQNKIDKQKFNQVSQLNQPIDHNLDCRSIKKLQSELQYISPTDTIYSTINGFVTLMSFKGKWFYESCPKCKKGSADKDTLCIHCGVHIEESIPRFILPIEIADYSGSLWTTAFDDFAGSLLHGRQIRQLEMMDELRLREEVDTKIFQEFRFRISSKKDEHTGNIKHAVLGKPIRLNMQKTASENIQRIFQYL